MYVNKNTYIKYVLIIKWCVNQVYTYISWLYIETYKLVRKCAWCVYVRYSSYLKKKNYSISRLYCTYAVCTELYKFCCAALDWSTYIEQPEFNLCFFRCCWCCCTVQFVIFNNLRVSLNTIMKCQLNGDIP